MVKTFNHLPVCHSSCFIRERDQLQKAGRRRGSASPDNDLRLPVCHRKCYYAELRRQKGGDGALRNKTGLEMIGWPKLSHMFTGTAKYRGSSEVEDDGDRQGVDRRRKSEGQQKSKSRWKSEGRRKSALL